MSSRAPNAQQVGQGGGFFHSGRENFLSLDLHCNSLTEQFFAGWAPKPAVQFAQNLLLIGIGIAYKLLHNNDPDAAYQKLHKMARNVMREYLPRDQPNSNGNQEQDRQEQFTKQHVPRYSTTHSNHLNSGGGGGGEGGGGGNKHLAERELKVQIAKVKHRLGELTDKLTGQGVTQPTKAAAGFPNSAYKMNDSRRYEEGTKPSAAGEGYRASRSRLNSPVTPKITSSPPPHPKTEDRVTSAQICITRSHHLNDDAVKQCLTIPSQPTPPPPPHRHHPQSQQYEDISSSLYTLGNTVGGIPQRVRSQASPTIMKQQQQKMSHNSQSINEDIFRHDKQQQHHYNGSVSTSNAQGKRQSIMEETIAQESKKKQQKQIKATQFDHVESHKSGEVLAHKESVGNIGSSCNAVVPIDQKPRRQNKDPAQAVVLFSPKARDEFYQRKQQQQQQQMKSRQFHLSTELALSLQQPPIAMAEDSSLLDRSLKVVAAAERATGNGSTRKQQKAHKQNIFEIANHLLATPWMREEDDLRRKQQQIKAVVADSAAVQMSQQNLSCSGAGGQQQQLQLESYGGEITPQTQSDGFAHAREFLSNSQVGGNGQGANNGIASAYSLVDSGVQSRGNLQQLPCGQPLSSASTKTTQDNFFARSSELQWKRQQEFSLIQEEEKKKVQDFYRTDGNCELTQSKWTAHKEPGVGRREDGGSLDQNNNKSHTRENNDTIKDQRGVDPMRLTSSDFSMPNEEIYQFFRSQNFQLR